MRCYNMIHILHHNKIHIISPSWNGRRSCSCSIMIQHTFYYDTIYIHIIFYFQILINTAIDAISHPQLLRRVGGVDGDRAHVRRREDVAPVAEAHLLYRWMDGWMDGWICEIKTKCEDWKI